MDKCNSRAKKRQRTIEKSCEKRILFRVNDYVTAKAVDISAKTYLNCFCFTKMVSGCSGKVDN